MGAGPQSCFLTHPAWGRAHLRRLLVNFRGTVPSVGVGDDGGGGEGLAVASGGHVFLRRKGEGQTGRGSHSVEGSSPQLLVLATSFLKYVRMEKHPNFPSSPQLRTKHTGRRADTGPCALTTSSNPASSLAHFSTPASKDAGYGGCH